MQIAEPQTLARRHAILDMRCVALDGRRSNALTERKSTIHFSENGIRMTMNAAELIDHVLYPECLDHLADDVEWVLPVSVGGTHKGKVAVLEMLDGVMTQFYDPTTISADVITAFGTENFATMVFVMSATTRWGQAYRNQYSITIQTAEGKITRVYELCDTKNLFDTMDIPGTMRA
ncbi:hypothetical protein BS297_07005 [Rhodococcus erythropolis]|uniref:SnoaL-like domain-containing protein n=1 Tax=Rhodococcus erythropolis TaxID=1833 RepID=A0A5N5EF41_RHOER|nr:hypothetical protein BS297_07005 [Rhodococcus erythropolis]